MSKTFENFLKAKDRLEVKAKERVDRLNHLALQKVKNSKKAEMANKDHDFLRKERLEKEMEKFTNAKKRKDLHMKELNNESSEYYQQSIKEVEERLRSK